MTATPRRRLGAVALGTVLVLVPTGCGSATSSVYDESAVKVLEATLSEGRTAELAGRLWVEGRNTHPFAAVVVDDSDSGVGAEVAWFEAQQPPTPTSDAVRERTVEALDGVASAVQSVRIALDRKDRATMRSALDDLTAACEDVELLAEELG